MLVAMLVIVPISRGFSCGVECFPRSAYPGERAFENVLEALGLHVHRRFASGLDCVFRSSSTPFSSDAR